MVDNNKTRGVKTTETVFDILEQLHEENGCRITEIAESLGIAKSTAHRHLTTLEQKKYVFKENDVYFLGLKFLKMGEDARTRKDYYTLAEPIVEEIAETTGERAQFLVEEHGKAVYLYRSVGEHGVQTEASIGTRIDLHSTASGKVILAYLPEDRVVEIIEEQGLTPRTNQTITETDALFEELEEIRKRGYSYNDQESVEGLRGLSVPVTDLSDHIIGALSISGPTQRMKGERFREDLPELLLGFANELELNITYLFNDLPRPS